MAFIISLSHLLLLLFFSLFSNPLAAAQHDDNSTMLALQEELIGSGWDARNWDYCLWVGVRCSSNRSVERLELSHRELRGNVSLISKLKGLMWLDLSYNSFHGPIPPAFGNLTKLEYLDLSSNKFETSIPPQLGNLKNLRALNLSNNLLLGSIPDELHGLERLQELQMSANRLNGSIPGWVGNLTNLTVLAAYENFLGGRIPENLGSVSKLRMLNLHSNQLGGSIPEGIFNSGKLEVLVLTQNELNGSLPNSVGNCRGLSSLRIGNNKLVGSIPVAIGNCSSLTYFEANNNFLTGDIVAEFAQCSNLTLLNLASNGLTGTIPPELGKLPNLQEFIVSDNSLTGEIPTSLFKCMNLNKLDLRSNRFNGTISKDLCNMSRLQFLHLGQNLISGGIPNEIGNCVRLLELQMGGNHLTGNIPPEIGLIKNLQIALNLSFNHLHGPIPRELGRLDKLVSLRLSHNQLTGAIPSELKGMLSLIDIDFSNNLLVGQIPTFGPFQKSPSLSFSGNKGLCGEPLSTFCHNSAGSNHGNHHTVSYKIILAVVGSVVMVFTVVAVVILLFMMRERQEMAAKTAGIEEDKAPTPPSILASNIFVENLKQAIDFESAVKATLSDSNRICIGTFSSVYRAVMPSGLILSVKRLKSMDRTITHHRSKMIRELERLGNVSHDNLLKLIGFVICEDVALLLHPYFPNGTLFQLIHEHPQAECEPDWPRRLSIAIGAARGLAFLHSVAVIHLDISSNNVVLDADFNPLLGEIEISKLLDPSRGTASISAVAGSFGYIPPEYAYMMQVTAPGNVYSFGVVLLEILTSRLPIEEAFGEGMDLVKWVNGAPLRRETPEQILDSRLSTVSFMWRKQMLGVLKVALLCTDASPANRPKMKKVVEMLLEVVEG
ncbi:hypothetical protein ACLOJK_016093 [Asimina triloba]